MLSTDFVFVHGWGMGPDFWDDLIDYLPAIKAHKIDIGFVGGHSFLDATSSSAVYVTHSLGTMWALNNHSENMKALIAINGFSCFKNFADANVLLTMKAQLERNPKIQMKKFWAYHGLPPSDKLNIEKLQMGLDWLMSWNTKDILENIQRPVLSLAGSDDRLLPINLMKEEWSGFDLCIREGGGHALPLSDTRWCADHIRELFDEL